MVTKLLIPLSLCILFTTKAATQSIKPKYSIGIESQFLLAGEINASFDLIGGVRGQYFLKSQGWFTPIISAGLATDIGNTDARIMSIDLMIGSDWAFRKRLTLMASIGSHYINESHRFQLNERNKNWQNSIIGITGNIGIEYSISNTISSNLFIKQTNLTYTSIGFGLKYSF